jgi:hypothetical protein
MILYNGQDIAACADNNWYGTNKIDCTFHQEACDSEGCNKVLQTWKFDFNGNLESQQTCFQDDRICVDVQYSNNVPINCVVSTHFNGETCSGCALCAGGVSVDACDTQGLDMSGCMVDLFMAATPTTAGSAAGLQDPAAASSSAVSVLASVPAVLLAAIWNT